MTIKFRMRLLDESPWVLVLLVLATLCLYTTNSATIPRRAPLTNNPAPAPINPSYRGNTRRIMEPAFQNAGQTAGLQIWRIENFKPVPYPPGDYGKFYTGDSYIILFTKERRGSFSWDIHFWLGRDTSQDESGAAAILAVTLDDQLGGNPVQYREVQEHESQLFLSYFKSGIRYLPGGVNSGFKHVDRNAPAQKKLYQVKGKRNIRVKQVDVSVASMNKGDCFILDTGNDIYVFTGAASKRTERLKAISAANLIRDQDHGGRSRVHVIDEFSNEVEVGAFFNAIGGGSPANIPDESAGGDDDAFERSEEQHVTLYRVSDSNGQMNVQSISQKPIRQNLLDSNDCFILDTADANLYVWVGRKCNQNEKTESMNKAQMYLTSKKYPGWTHVERIIEGSEPSIFRQYFTTWQGVGEVRPRIIRSVERTKEAKSSGELTEFLPDDGSGKVEIYRVEDFKLVPVQEKNYGKFFGGDSYVIKYKTTDDKWIIYIWQGEQSSLDEKAVSAIHAINLDRELGGKAVQVRVPQNSEPKHFLQIFKGKLITFLGGHASGFKNIRDYDTYVEGAVRMFVVRGTNELDVRASQQLLSANSLSSDDVFVVEDGTTAWIWIGKDSNEEERSLVKKFVKSLAPDAETISINEGNEPEKFWDALGGQGSYSSSLQKDLHELDEPRLFHVHLKADGSLSYEEIHNFEQDDLVDDDIMVLDTGDEVYVWVGNESTDAERKEALKELNKRLIQDHRKQVVILTIKQGEEPISFTSLFPAWNEHFWSTLPSYEQIKSKLAESNNSIED